MRPKSLLTTTLLLFVAVSVGILIGKERGARPAGAGASAGTAAAPATAESGPRVIAYDLHGQARCVTCRTIEAYAQEAIDTHFADELKSGRLEVRSVNFEEPENQHFLDDDQLVSSSLVLVDPHAHGPGSWKLLQDVGRLAERLRSRAESGGILGAGALGHIFALSFCPISAALFFGSLIPLAVKLHSRVVLPTVYGIGTGLPVFLFAVLIAVGMERLGRAFNALKKFERWARVATGVAFIGLGIDESLRSIYGVI